MFIDPNGLEKIVLTGGIAGYEKFDYMFVETSIKTIKDMQNNSNEKLAWIVTNAGYSEPDIYVNFRDVADSLGVNLIIMNDKQQLINYINTKNINEETRKSDPITQFAVLSHGYANELALAHGHSTEISDKLNFKTNDISKLKEYAFNNTSSWFGSCNTGTQNLEGINFAQTWVNKTGGTTTAVVNGTTDYTNINVWEDKKWYHRLDRFFANGFSKNGSKNLPVASDGVKWNTFTPNK